MRHVGAWMLVLGLFGSGCASSSVSYSALERVRLRERAIEYLTSAVTYPENPVVRVEAVEALQECESADVLPWLRTALLDDQPAVRFSACVALGVRRDHDSEAAIRNCTGDSDHNVMVAALFALHELGDDRGTGKLATFLLEDESAAVRRHAAFVLGLTGEAGVIPMLARAMKDRDRGVRQHALEAMARLGNEEATQELIFMTNSGVGSEEVFAIRALAATRDPHHGDTFRYKLANAMHSETRLAAAYALGLLGDPVGYSIALEGLTGGTPPIPDVKDPPAGQRLRRVQLAAVALGAIGRIDALPRLSEILEGSHDPRVQVSAARAIVEVLQTDRAKALPFPTGQDGRAAR